MNHILRFTILFCIFLITVTCQKDDPDQIPEDTIEKTTLIKEETKTESISASVGGTIELSSGVKIEIPANSLTADKTITLESIDPFLIENEAKIDDELNGLKVSGIVRCEPSGTTFSTPIKIEIPYFEKLLPDDTPIDSIEVISFSNNKIESIPFVIDKTNKVVIAEVTHFSDFTLKVKKGNWEISKSPEIGLNGTNNYMTISFKTDRNDIVNYIQKWAEEEDYIEYFLYQEIYYNVKVYRKQVAGKEFIGGRQIYKSWLKTRKDGNAFFIRKGSKAENEDIYESGDFPNKADAAAIFEKTMGGSKGVTVAATNSLLFNNNKEIEGSVTYKDLGTNVPEDFLPSFMVDGNSYEVDIINRDLLDPDEKYFLIIEVKGRGNIVNDSKNAVFESSYFRYDDVGDDGDGSITWNEKPIISNIKPSNNLTFKFKENFTLSCSVNDKEDGQLSGSSVKWEWHTNDNQIFELGTGSSLSSTNFKKELSIGSQTIYVVATDATGASTQVSFKINIANNPSEVSISSPANSSSYELDDEISFVGKITDVEDGTNVNLDAVIWNSDKDGEIEKGDLDFKYSSLKIGTHEISLEYTDDHGKKSTAKSVIAIGIKKPEVVFTDGEWLIWESNNSVTIKGKVTDNGGGDIKDKGFVLSTETAEPTLENNDVKVSGGSGEGFYSVTVENLEYKKAYFVRAYADNGKVAYSSNFKDFTIKENKEKPTVTTTTPTNITTSVATVGGNVTSDGSLEVTERGIYYGTSQKPESTGTKVEVGSGIGEFSKELVELDVDKTYYVKAYAINSEGTSYGREKQFKTEEGTTKPTVTTTTPANITSSSSTVGGHVTSDGSSELTERGIYYGTTENPESTGTKVKIGSGSGEFSKELTGLNGDKTYYVKAYAINNVGESYGEQKQFTTITSQTEPAVITDNATNVTFQSAILNGNVTSDGNSTIVKRGFYWSKTNSNPNINDNIEIVDGTLGTFEEEINGLEENTTYYYRAFAENGIGSTEGDVKSFTTRMTTIEGNFIKIGNKQYELVSGWLGGFGKDEKDDDWNFEGFQQNFVLMTEGLSIIEEESVGELVGDGNFIFFQLFSTTNNDLDEGEYIYHESSPFSTQTFEYGVQSGKIGDSNVDGSEIHKGKIMVQKANSEYEIYIDCTDENDVSIEGYYKGEISVFVESETSTLTDSRDNTTYKTVKIGEHWWMAENLAYDVGDDCWAYDDDESNVAAYGRLYTWEAAKEACPDGWHLPTDDEWKQMEMAIGMSQSEADSKLWRGTNEGTKLKTTSGWAENGNGTDFYGFSGIPSGYRDEDGSFSAIGDYVSLWTSTEYGTSNAWGRDLSYGQSNVFRLTNKKEHGCGVRCVRD